MCSSDLGEADAVVKSADAVAPDADLADRSSMVHRGTSVAQGTGRAVVVATGADTEMGAIARMLDSVEEEGTPLQREITRISKMLGAVVIVIAVVVVATLLALAPERTAQTVTDALLLGVSLAVAAVPEGLPAILSVVLALGVQRIALHKTVVKSRQSFFLSSFPRPRALRRRRRNTTRGRAWRRIWRSSSTALLERA